MGLSKQKQSEFGGEMHLGDSFAPFPVAIQNHSIIIRRFESLEIKSSLTFISPSISQRHLCTDPILYNTY